MKIQNVFMAILVLLSLGFLYLISVNYSLLNSDKGVDFIMDEYHRNADLLTYGVPSVFLILLIMSNTEFYKGGTGWGFLWSGLFFSIFTGLDWIFISGEFFHFKQRMGVWKGEYSLAGIFGLFLILMCVMVTIGNYFLIKTMRKFRK